MIDISMKWKMWYGNETLTINLPDTWSVEKFLTKKSATITNEEIKSAILNPIGMKSLREDVENKKTVCIAMDDMTKPTETFRTAPIIIDELIKGGIKKEDIFFIVSMGSHRTYTIQDLKKKVGDEIIQNFRIYNHSPYQNNRFIGETKRGTKLFINNFFLDADYKIAIGMLMPHNLAGFSGGGKMVLPGLASIETIDESHKATLRGLQGKIGCMEGNQVRADIDEAARKAGLNFIVNSIHNDFGETVKIFCGDLEKAYKAGVEEAVKIYACKPTYNNDIGIFNAFPRDQFFLLSLSSMDVWSTRDKNKEIVKQGGTIVIINNCSEGSGGEHGLHGKGMRHYVMRDEHGTFKEILKDRDLIFFSPNLNMGVIKDYYRKEVKLCKKWEDVLALLLEKHGDKANVSVYPSGTLIMDETVIQNKI